MTQKTQNLIFAENILKLQKELRIAQDAINSLIQLETKGSKKIEALQNDIHILSEGTGVCLF